MKRLILICALAMVACSNADNGAAMHAGTLVLTLTTPGTTDGGVVLLVSGGPVTSVDAPAQYQIASNADAAGTHLAVIGPIGSGAVATIHVPDVTRASAYVVTVQQVADRNSFGLLDPGPYHVVVSATP